MCSRGLRAAFSDTTRQANEWNCISGKQIQSPDLVASAHKFPSRCGLITLPTAATADSILSAAAMTTWESYQRSQIRSRRVAVWKCQQLGEVGSAVIRTRLFLVEVFWEASVVAMAAVAVEWQEVYIKARQIQDPWPLELSLYSISWFCGYET